MMEAGRQQYDSIMEMPIKRMKDYIKWKMNLEEDKAKVMKEKSKEAQSMMKRKKK
jgi:hypothetical protein